MRTEPLAAINSLALAIGTFDSLQEMLRYALAKVLEVLEADAAGVYVLDEERGHLVFTAQQGLSDEASHDFDALPLGEGLSGRVALLGSPIILRNLKDHPQLTRMAARAEGIRAFASVPMRFSYKTLSQSARQPAFYVANRAHHSDVGGMTPGSMPLAREVYQEGLIIPPIKLARRGAIVTDVLDFILANVRTPDEREGDLTAQIAANRVADARLRQIVAKYGRARTERYASALQDYTERVLRATIAKLPDGEYTFEDRLDDDGFNDKPITIRVVIRIKGDGAEVDFTGSDPQTTGGVNANFAITLSATLYGFRCLIDDDVLYNDGIGRAVRVVVPMGTIVNAMRPSAVAGGNVETSQRIIDVVLGALSQAVPDRIPAASQRTMNNVTLGGIDPRSGHPFAYYETIGGGMGARPGLDGISGVHTHMSNTRNTPVEALEHYLPVRLHRYGLRAGSGGAGRYRGGNGIVREYEMLTETAVTVLSDRRKGAPYGAQGGEPGRPGVNTVVGPQGSREVGGKATLTLHAGERLRIETPGGGGFGSPGSTT